MNIEIKAEKEIEYKEDPETGKIWRRIMLHIESYRKFWNIGQAE